MINKKPVFFVGSITFILLLILSIVYFQERTVFIDIAYHLFYILKDDAIAIQNSRFGAFITQIFPLWGSRAGLSLKGVAILYSMSFIMVPFLGFLYLLFGLKNQRIALAYLVYILLMLTHTFYWTQSELPQAMFYFFLLIGIWDNYLKKSPSNINIGFWIISILLTITVCITHPLTIFPFTFWILFMFFKGVEKRTSLLILAGLYIAVYLSKNTLFKSDYDGGAMDGVKNFIYLFPDYFTIQSTKNLARYFLYDYYVAFILFWIVFIHYLLNKKYLLLMLISTYFIGYALLVNVSYPGGGVQFYLENFYLLLAFFIAMPFVLDVLPSYKNKHFSLGLIALICLIGVFRINHRHVIYTERLDWNKALLEKTNTLDHKKLIIPAEEVPHDLLLMTWGSSYEFWLLSTLETGISRSIIIEEQAGEFDWALDQNEGFISKWGVFDYKELNPKYFNFKDKDHYVKYRN